MVRVLFICTENSTRSQMAEAFARIHGEDLVEAWSAGSNPGRAINPRAVEAMREKGYDLSGHRPKGLAEVGYGPWDYFIRMGCGDQCAWMPAAHQEDWDLPDPATLSPEQFREMRDDIERRVLDLLARIRAAARKARE
jgi:arsenate reductase